MASVKSFRNHVMLVVFIDILFLLLILPLSSPTGIDSFDNNNESKIMQFIENPSISDSSLLWVALAALIASFSIVGISSSGSNFGSITGALATGFAKIVKGATTTIAAGAKTGAVMFLLLDYVVILKIIVSAGGLVGLVATFIITPLIIDGMFAGIDWVRGVNL